jgi:hypothetical protein
VWQTDQHSVELIAHLEGHPSWQALERLAAQKRETMLARLAKQIAVGDLEPDDVRDIRAFLKGMDALISAPRNALKELD